VPGDDDCCNGCWPLFPFRAMSSRSIWILDVSRGAELSGGVNFWDGYGVGGRAGCRVEVGGLEDRWGPE